MNPQVHFFRRRLQRLCLRGVCAHLRLPTVWSCAHGGERVRIIIFLFLVVFFLKKNPGALKRRQWMFTKR